MNSSVIVVIPRSPVFVEDNLKIFADVLTAAFQAETFPVLRNWVKDLAAVNEAKSNKYQFFLKEEKGH